MTYPPNGSGYAPPTGLPPYGLPFAPHRGGTILALGILSIVFCPLFGPFAWVMGSGDLGRMNQGLLDPTGRGATEAGRLCGIIGTLLGGLALVVILLLFTVAVGSFSPR